MTSKELFSILIDHQDKLNIQIKGSNWKSLNLPWKRPIWIELAELLNIFDNWKWWKKGGSIEKYSEKWYQAVLEYVDTLHFVISKYLAEEKELDLPAYFASAWEVSSMETDCDIADLCENIVSILLTYKTVPMTKFFNLGRLLQLSLIDIVKLYLAKNVLNNFRQKHGYKTGEYIKIWNGKEDNYYLAEIIFDLPFNTDFESIVMDKLEIEYGKIKNRSKGS